MSDGKAMHQGRGIGVALSVTVNLPFSVIQSASVRRNADGSGDIAFELEATLRGVWGTWATGNRAGAGWNLELGTHLMVLRLELTAEGPGGFLVRDAVALALQPGRWCSMVPLSSAVFGQDCMLTAATPASHAALSPHLLKAVKRRLPGNSDRASEKLRVRTRGARSRLRRTHAPHAEGARA